MNIDTIITQEVSSASKTGTDGSYLVLSHRNALAAKFRTLSGFKNNAVAIAIYEDSAKDPIDPISLLKYFYDGDQVFIKNKGIFTFSGSKLVPIDLSENVRDDVKFNNKFLVPSVVEIVRGQTAQPTATYGIHTVTHPGNSLAASFRVNPTTWKSNPERPNEPVVGVTVFIDGTNPIKLLRYEHAGNNINLNGFGIHSVDSSGLWTQVLNATTLMANPNENVIDYVKNSIRKFEKQSEEVYGTYVDGSETDTNILKKSHPKNKIYIYLEQ